MIDVLEQLDDLAIKVGPSSRESEIQRIIGLPVCGKPERADLDDASFRWVQGDHWARGFRLFDAQAAGILSFERTGKLFGLIPVGWGKTLLTLMVADHAYRQEGVKRSVLFIPASAWDQFSDIDLRWARSKTGLRVPVHLLGRRSPTQRWETARARWPGLYVMTSSLMERPDAADLLDRIGPELVIVDEAHKFKYPQTPSTARLLNYLKGNPRHGVPRKRLVALSGTMTTRGMRDYWHLITLCLNEDAPVPLSPRIAMAWAELLDSGAAMHPADAGPLADLVAWAQEHTTKPLIEDLVGFRRAFSIRLSTAPGAVSYGGAKIRTVLVIENRPVPDYKEADGYEELQALARAVEREGVAPNGDDIEHAIVGYGWLYQLAAGIFYDTFWPGAAELAKQKHWPLEKAAALLELAERHHAAQQAYHKILRKFLARKVRGLDTPFLVMSELQRTKDKHVPGEVFKAWKTMHDLDDADLPRRSKRPIRVSPFRIDEVIHWAKEIGGRDAIVWYQHDAVGEWFVERARAAGLDAAQYRAGHTMNRAIRDPSSGKGVAVASMPAHHQAKNLQHFKHVGFLQWSRPAGRTEQVLGRVHRNGQTLDELVVTTFNTIPFDYMNFSATLIDACYVQQAAASRQKILTCTHRPTPKVFAPEVLQELGFQPQSTAPEGKRLAEERFGAFEKQNRS